MKIKKIKDVLVCRRSHMQVFIEGFDSVLRPCLSADTDMRPSSYAVRTALENQTLTHARAHKHTAVPCEAAIICLLKPNACSRLPLSMNA